MRKIIKDKLKTVALVSLTLIIANGLYRLSIGCRGMFSDCYIEGVDKFIYLYYLSNLLFYVCCLMVFFKFFYKSALAIIKNIF
jgi:hypothetical protein